MKKTLMILIAIMGSMTLSAQDKWAWLDSSSKVDPILPGVVVNKIIGNVVTAGSSTVYPLSEAIVTQLKKEGFKGNISIDSIGTGAGFERFTKAGESDIANASRGIKSGEIDSAKKIGRDPIEIRVGTDALAVVVSSKNTFVKEITQKELALLFSTAVNWSDVRPTWPKAPIQRFVPGTDSGTFDYFVEHVFNKKKEPILSAPNTQKSEDDNILVKGIEGSPNAIGFFGYAYFDENKKGLRALDIDGVTPGQASVDNGKYPLARPLFLYTTAKIIQEKPQVGAFLVYYLTNVNRVIKKAGYFPAPKSELDKSKNLLKAALKK